MIRSGFVWTLPRHVSYSTIRMAVLSETGNVSSQSKRYPGWVRIGVYLVRYITVRYVRFVHDKLDWHIFGTY